jgi:hypothetical protein
MKCNESIPTNICGQEATVDTHDFILDEVVEGCTVEILKCRKCGEYSIGWKRGADESI